MSDEGGRSKALTDALANLLVLDYREGASLRQVARIYGVGYGTAHRICAAAGVLRDQPGDGCDDPRDVHPHWCGFCGAKLMFSAVECRQLYIVPPCLRCGERQWRSEVDELTAPDYREEPTGG